MEKATTRPMLNRNKPTHLSIEAPPGRQFNTNSDVRSPTTDDQGQVWNVTRLGAIVQTRTVMKVKLTLNRTLTRASKRAAAKEAGGRPLADPDTGIITITLTNVTGTNIDLVATPIKVAYVDD